MFDASVRKGFNLLLCAALLALAGQAVAKSRIGDWKREAESDNLAYHGYKYLGDDKAKAAEKFFEKATKLDPDNASALEGLGDTWSALGKDEKAESAWSTADQLTHGRSSRTRSMRLGKDGSPTDLYLQNSMGASDLSSRAYKAETKGDFKFALELFKKALAIDKNYWHARTGINEILAGALDQNQTLPTRAGSGRDGAGDDE
jgi:Tfp pilus assembly protein PilF